MRVLKHATLGENLRWIKNWPNRQAQCSHHWNKVSWRPVNSGQHWVQSCLTPSLMIWMMGQSSPAATLQVTETWEEWLIQQGVILPPRRTSAGWRNGLTGTTPSSVRGNVESCTWTGTTPRPSTC